MERDEDQLKQIAAHEVSNYVQASIHFAGILIANLMILNGGGLLVFPSYISEKTLSEMNLINISNAAMCFVFGIIFSAICGYLAYLNYVFNANSTYTSLNRDIYHIIQKNDSEYKHRLAKWYEDKIKEQDKHTKKYNSYVSITFYVSQMCGIVSLFLFVLGCYYTRLAMLSLT